jgi:preprotein translocase subunit SecA
MIGSITRSLKKIFGDKSTRDMKTIQPLVELINAECIKLKDLSNDQLRNKTLELKTKIQDGLAEQRAKVETMKADAESDSIGIVAKEALYKQVDDLIKKIDQDLEVILLEVLPEAFAIVKDTSRRFTENNELRVTAQQFDRDLAAISDHISIEGETAIWQNTWIAGGSSVTWEMIHYDVQLSYIKGRLLRCRQEKERPWSLHCLYS